MMLKHHKLIDSTNIVEFSGCLNFDYYIKIKNKMPHIIDVSKGSIHDAKIINIYLI